MNVRVILLLPLVVLALSSQPVLAVERVDGPRRSSEATSVPLGAAWPPNLDAQLQSENPYRVPTGRVSRS